MKAAEKRWDVGTNPEVPPTTMIFLPMSLSADLAILRVLACSLQDMETFRGRKTLPGGTEWGLLKASPR
jgi:hypothetical protein